LSLGWTYESDKSKKANAGKMRSQVSTKHLSFLEATMKSLCHFNKDISLDVLMTMQVMPICGADTLLHTNSCCGETANYVM